MLEREGSHHFSTHGDVKAAVVERFNHTLKKRMYRYFIARNTPNVSRCLTPSVEWIQPESARNIDLSRKGIYENGRKRSISSNVWYPDPWLCINLRNGTGQGVFLPHTSTAPENPKDILVHSVTSSFRNKNANGYFCMYSFEYHDVHGSRSRRRNGTVRAKDLTPLSTGVELVKKIIHTVEQRILDTLPVRETLYKNVTVGSKTVRRKTAVTIRWDRDNLVMNNTDILTESVKCMYFGFTAEMARNMGWLTYYTTSFNEVAHV